MHANKAAESMTVRSRKRGSVLVMSAAAAVFLLGLTAVVTDVGWMYYNQNKMQTGVNAAWKAAFEKLQRQVTAGGPLTASDTRAVDIRNLAKAVALQNGVVLQDDEIIVSSTSVRIQAKGSVDLAFAKVLGFDKANVSAARGGPLDSTTMGLIPLAIPLGEVHDTGKTTYTYTPFAWNYANPSDPANVGFIKDVTYILKLGSGNPQPTGIASQPPKILIPMGPGEQTDTGYQRAYGLAYRCLKNGAGDVAQTYPVEWLLGYNKPGSTDVGGSFLLPDNAEVRALLALADFKDRVAWTALNSDQVNQVYTEMKARNLNVLSITNRPKIAVYSSQPDRDPVEDVLVAAKIPYGAYASTMARSDTYSSGNNTKIYDGEILDGALDNYHWLHLHHEDFTGYSSGCSNWESTCKTFFDRVQNDSSKPYYNERYLGSRASSVSRTAMKNRCCSYCKPFYQVATDSWVTSNPSYRPTTAAGAGWNCQNYRRRCAEKRNANGLYWRDDPRILVCKQGDDVRPGCREYQRQCDVATARGLVADANSCPKDQIRVSQPNYTIARDNASFFMRADLPQKGKWAVVRKVRDHVNAGGYLYAQCFALETLDLALYQSGIHGGEGNAGALNANQAYDECIAFEKFYYMSFPRATSPEFYSDINTAESGSPQLFTLTGDATDPTCQNHSTSCSIGSGHTAAVNKSKLKNTTIALGVRDTNSDHVKYMKGTYGKGSFAFAGGHDISNTPAKRLVLNNVLLGSLVTKELIGDPPETGKQKNQYGPIDPDNTTAGGANDYRDRFMYGYQNEIKINYRITPEAGNMAGPTDQAVTYRLQNSGIVVVPITDIPPEVKANNAHNTTAETIYDLQGQDHPNGAYMPDAGNPDTAFGSSVRIIGFAMFEIQDAAAFDASDPSRAAVIGFNQAGQVKGKFIDYVIRPGEIPLQ